PSHFLPNNMQGVLIIFVHALLQSFVRYHCVGIEVVRHDALLNDVEVVNLAIAKQRMAQQGPTCGEANANRNSVAWFRQTVLRLCWK
ncbi:MAG: hypothetical protein ACKPJJ_25455, partial [Planctomycetaceae bacterium]